MKKKYYIGPCFINLINNKDLLNQLYHDLTVQYKKTQIYLYCNIGSFYYFLSQVFQRAYSQADFSYLNSVYLSFFYRLIFGLKFRKSNVEDFIYDLCLYCQNIHKKVMLLGSTEKTNRQAIVNLHKQFPSLKLKGYYGYFHNNDKVMQIIQSYKPDIIFVGLGYGLQEQWLYKNKESLNQVLVCMTVGNYIEIIGEQVKLPSYFFKISRLEWLYRLIKEPRRLWKRYLFGLCFFLKEVIKSNLKTRK